MIEKIIELVTVQLYWGSLLLIGWGMITKVDSTFRVRSNLRIREFTSYFPLPLRLLFWFMVAFTTLGLFSVLLYIFQLPVWVFVLAYVAGLVNSAACVLACFNTERQRGDVLHRMVGAFRLPGDSKVIITVLILLTCALMGDYLFALYVGGQVAEGSDSYVFMAKAVTMIANGFSLDDGFISDMPETRYHFNALLALYTTPSFVTNNMIIPMETWRWSFAFFRMLEWMAIFSLAYSVFSKWLQFDKKSSLIYASVALITAVAMFSDDFMKANFPNQVSNVWIILFVLGIILLESTKWKRETAIGLIVLPALALGLTHPTYALILFIFTVSFLSYLLFFTGRRFFGSDIRKNTLYIIGCTILIISPLITYLMPNRIGEYPNSDNIQTTEIAGVDIIIPLIPRGIIGVAVTLLGVVGYGYMLVKLRRRRDQLALLTALLSFFLITGHNPVFMAVADGVLPLWLINRFLSMNVLSYIVAVVGVYVLVSWAAPVVARKRKLPRNSNVIAGTTLAACLVVSSLYITESYRYTYHWTKGIERGYYAFIDRTYDSFSNKIPTGSVLLANSGDSYFFPAVIPTKVVAVHFGHATPSVDAGSRLACQEALLSDYDPDNLAFAEVDYIVVARWEGDYERRVRILENNPSSYKLFSSNQDYVMYEFLGPEVVDENEVADSCREYKDAEMR